MNFQNKSILTILFVSMILLLSCTVDKQKNIQTKALTPNISWPITSYNFGQMEELSIPEQIALLSKSGYKGLILKSASKKDFDNFEEYMRVSESTDNFKVDAVFELYKIKDDAERRERWKLVVDRIAGKDTQLWMIFGKDGFDDAFIEKAVAGDSKTTLARKALRNYLEKNNDSSLTAEHKIYIEDYLQKSVVHSGGVAIGSDVAFSKTLLRNAIEKSKTLSDDQLNNLKKYSSRVSNL